MRAIDADALKERIRESLCIKSFKYLLPDEKAIVSLIDSMPTVDSAQSEPQWILCSKRLPEHDDYDETFQVTIQCEHVDGWDDYVSGYADWSPYGWDIQSCYQGQIKVVAWMPMPKAYCPEGDDKE